MKAILSLIAALGFAIEATASTTNLIQNGSFESGTNNWLVVSGPSKSVLTNWAYHGTNALMITNRSSFTNTPRQDVTAMLAAAAGCTNWTTRFAVSVASPTTVRAWLQVTANNGSGLQTFRYLLAERVVRETNQWKIIAGTKTVDWPGALSNAVFFTEVGMRQEPTAGGFAYPNCVLDDFNVKPDTDADGLWDEEEVAIELGGKGTDPLLKDSDGDGLPDGWEVAQGLDARPIFGTNGVAGKNGDADNDGFSNWEEFCGDTQPTNAISFPGKPCHSNLTESARAVLTYLARLPSHATNRVIVGQHLTDTNPEWTNYISTLPTLTGKWPGMVSFAAELGANAALQMNVVTPRVLEVWTNGGLPLIKWQMANPWRGTGTSPTGGEDIPEMLNPATVLATNQVARSNYLASRSNVADYLTTLRDAGAVVLWRPFSEMNGAWFWHGNKPRNHYIAFWRDLHDYFTTTRGLTNLLWVFEPDSSVHLASGATTSGTPIDYYYPGDDVVDVVGHNFYDNDWVLPYDSDAVWRGYGKIFAVPQAGSDDVRDGSWDNLTYLYGVTNTIPRLAFFCAWNTFVTGGFTITNKNSIVDNQHAIELMTNSLVVTREKINWQYELPMSLNVQSLMPGTLQIDWQGGVLQQSDDLLNWTDMPNAPRPLLHSGTNYSMGYWRLRK
ncbi:MAG: glycosyl hydrolase [Verrucomicrobiota bacterium]